MTRTPRSGDLVYRVARPLRCASDGLSFAIAHLEEVAMDAHRARAEINPALLESFYAVLRDAIALRDRVQTLRPRPIAVED